MKYQEYLLGDKGGRCVGPTALSPLCVDFLEILGASTSWSPQDLYRDCFKFQNEFVQRKTVIK